MNLNDIYYQPIQGKTYSLFGNADSTNEYYATIRSLADQILLENRIEVVLETVQKYSSRRKYLKRLATQGRSRSLISYCLNSVHSALKAYTVATRDHLKDLPLSKIWDRRLATSEEQYHLYMLEIELTNRLNRNSFLKADRKISLQPYCLQDFSVNCKASESGFDYQCKFCSKDCFQNHTSKLLEDNNVVPYVWMGASIGKAVKETNQRKQILGILGIACIPELVFGMRKCRKYQIPVVGLPLNANRCIRWFGEFHQNSIDLNQLEILVKK